LVGKLLARPSFRDELNEIELNSKK
jgi:hypothetical protein